MAGLDCAAGICTTSLCGTSRSMATQFCTNGGPCSLLFVGPHGLTVRSPVLWDSRRRLQDAKFMGKDLFARVSTTLRAATPVAMGQHVPILHASQQPIMKNRKRDSGKKKIRPLKIKDLIAVRV